MVVDIALGIVLGVIFLILLAIAFMGVVGIISEIIFYVKRRRNKND